MADLAKKLGIQPGQSVCLLDATPESAELLRQECPEGVAFSHTLGHQRYDIILFWPASLEGLTERFAQLQRFIIPEGSIWAAIPNKRYAKPSGITFTWAEMQGAGLQTDLVDNKTASLSGREYATRFVIRRDRRAKYT